MRNINEECGIFGVYSPIDTDVAQTTYYGLYALQHRGQESCGIAVSDNNIITYFKDIGLVHEVFIPERISTLGEGKIAIGHVRYCTTGSNDRINAQPIVVNNLTRSLALVHNGNLVNAYELRKELEEEGAIFCTTSDTEVISHIIIRERLKSNSIEEAIQKTMHIIQGAYSLSVIAENKLIVVRDMHGFRPLSFGKTEDGRYIVASESCALDVVGAKFIRDIAPGEIVVFDEQGIHSITDNCNLAPSKICAFEYIYFSRGDSIINGRSVYEARRTAGQCLAKHFPVNADIVIAVPDSGIDAALGYAEESGIPYNIGFIKNRYVARTFISAGQKARENKVRLKLNPISAVVKGKRLVLIDDSIVRGTTSLKIIQLLRNAGAKEIHMRVSAPPIINSCYYGVDIDIKEGLIAAKYSIKEIEKILGLDSLAFLSHDCLAKMLNTEVNKGYCCACFGGEYPTILPQNRDKNKFESKINSKKKAYYEKL